MDTLPQTAALGSKAKNRRRSVKERREIVEETLLAGFAAPLGQARCATKLGANEGNLRSGTVRFGLRHQLSQRVTSFKTGYLLGGNRNLSG